MFYVLRRLFLIPAPELGHACFPLPVMADRSDICSHPSYQAFSSFLSFALWLLICFSVNTLWFSLRITKVLVKGLMPMLWITFIALLMRAGRYGEHLAIYQSNVECLVSMFFSLQLPQHLKCKSGIMEKINDPSG